MFTIHAPDIFQDHIAFRYSCATYGDFTETVTFPVGIENPDDPILKALANLAAAFLGVSYYKLAAGAEIHAYPTVTENGQKAVEALYTKGLGEFYARNDLPYPPPIDFYYHGQTLSSTFVPSRRGAGITQATTAKTILAFGGGKDSHVAAHMLRDRGQGYALVSVTLADKVKTVLETLSLEPITFIDRRLDPKLIHLGKEGKGYNGHVPITAINSILLTIYGHLTDAAEVIFSNERGASVATRQYQEHAVNHQYSKSLEFEELFQRALKDVCDLNYYSLLRPYSELWIAKYLALNIPEAHKTFSSCNRNFVFEGKNRLAEGQKWCGHCSKCVYTAIILAPHTDIALIFGDDILQDKRNLQTMKDLTGLGDAKPWECVGDMHDTAAALYQINSPLRAALQDHYGMDALLQRFDREIRD